MLTHLIRALPGRQKGLTTVEYAVAGGLIVATLVGVFVALGGTVEGVIQGIIDALTGE